MKRWLVATLMTFGVMIATRAASPVGTAEQIEAELAAAVAKPEVTVVHLWAPWCGNCKREMGPEGWAKFVRENPAVRVVFVNIWHRGRDGRAELAAAGLGGQANFTSLTHPNASSRQGEKLERLLGQPVGWVPTTWVYREGKLRYALNYGEVRFEMLQQMVEDAGRKW